MILFNLATMPKEGIELYFDSLKNNEKKLNEEEKNKIEKFKEDLKNCKKLN